jgi:hypothetical protein
VESEQKSFPDFAAISPVRPRGPGPKRSRDSTRPPGGPPDGLENNSPRIATKVRGPSMRSNATACRCSTSPAEANVRPFEFFDFGKIIQTSGPNKKSVRETPCGNGPQTAQGFNPPPPCTARGRHRDFAGSDSKRFKFDAVTTKLLAGLRHRRALHRWCTLRNARKFSPSESKRIILDSTSPQLMKQAAIVGLSDAVGFFYLISRFCIRRPIAVRDPRALRDWDPPPCTPGRVGRPSSNAVWLPDPTREPR